MPNVVFAAPYCLETTLRFVRAALALPDVRLAVLSQEPVTSLPADLRPRIAGFERVEDAMDARQLSRAVRSLIAQMGGKVHALLGILEQMQVPLAEVREELSIRGMDAAEARNFRDKSRMKDVLRANGIPCARHALAASGREALGFAEECGFPLVVKPPAGAGARNTFRVGAREELESYLRTQPPSTGEPILLEEFITGKEHSFDTVTLHRRHVFHSISRYTPSPLEVMETPWIQWCVLLPRRVDGPEYADILEAGRAALDALGMVTGLSHMEWFRRADGSLAISEVGARPPGAQFTTLLSYAHDLDFYRAWTRLMIFEEFDAPERRFAAGAVYLRGQGDGQIRAVHGIDAAERELGGLIVEARLPRQGQPRAATYEGDGYVILRHPETEAVEHGLARLLQLIRVEVA